MGALTARALAKPAPETKTKWKGGSVHNRHHKKTKETTHTEVLLRKLKATSNKQSSVRESNIRFTEGKISIEHVTIIPSKYICKGAVDMKFS